MLSFVCNLFSLISLKYWYHMSSLSLPEHIKSWGGGKQNIKFTLMWLWWKEDKDMSWTYWHYESIYFCLSIIQISLKVCQVTEMVEKAI